jgi:limonene-1,2-epoxide hydrolase
MASEREQIVKAVEAYLNGLGRRDFTNVPFAPDVCYESPLSPRIEGREVVVRFLTSLFPIIKGVRVRQHIVEAPYCATAFDFDTAYGTIAVFDCFRVEDGLVKQIAPYYDPSIITNATAVSN